MTAIRAIVLACILPVTCANAQPAVPPEDGPMTALDAADFQLEDANDWLVSSLQLQVLAQKSRRRTLDQVMADTDRTATRISSLDNVRCFHTGFTFDGDDKRSCWRSQGISGSADAYPEANGLTPAGRKVLAVSWHNDSESCESRPELRHGSRVSFIDVTSMDRVKYRHVLLVEPCEADSAANFCAVQVHAGGIAWVGKYLYVVDTTRGFRVFDTEWLLEVNDTDTVAAARIGVFGDRSYAFKYKYVLPQVGRYRPAGRDLIFSWTSLDRSSSPPSLLSGEYEEGRAGRVFRWNLLPNGRLTDAGGRISAAEARFIAQRRVQGGLSRSARGVTKYWFVASPNRDSDRLYRKTTTRLEAIIPFARQGTPQTLHHSPFSDNLWSLDEYNDRPVFACKFSDVD